MNDDPSTYPTNERLQGSSGSASSAAAGASREVVGEARQQVGAVASETKQQISSMMGQTRSEIRDEMNRRSEKLAGSLEQLSSQLGALGQGRTDEAGQLSKYVYEAQERVQQVAAKLETGGPQAVVDDIARFARRKPGTFLLAAGAAGFLIGRTVRASSSRPTLGQSYRHESIDAPPATPMLVTPTGVPTDDLAVAMDDGAVTGVTGMGIR